jgi:hypothetical protein
MKWISNEIHKIENRIQGSMGYGPIAAIFTFFQGRATTFAILFAATGVVLTVVAIWGFLHHYDLSSFASFVLALAALNGSIQAMMFAHSCKEDWANLRQQQIDQQSANPQPNAPNVQVQVAPTNHGS